MPLWANPDDRPLRHEELRAAIDRERPDEIVRLDVALVWPGPWA